MEAPGASTQAGLPTLAMCSSQAGAVHSCLCPCPCQVRVPGTAVVHDRELEDGEIQYNR
jgi:hypothetical protein